MCRRSPVAPEDIIYFSLQWLPQRRAAAAKPRGPILYRLAHSKTNQSGRDHPENYKPV